MPTPRALPALTLVFAVIAGACGATTPTKTSTTPTKLTGSLTVFAAASLTEGFNSTKARLESRNPSLALAYSFAGSQTLVAQIEQGAPADVIATADTSSIETLSNAGLVERPQVFAHNSLEIAVAPGNPKHVETLSDLAKPGLKVVLADPSVPAGKFAKEALGNAHVTVAPVSQPLDVKAVLQTVTSGEADAAIVYVTDVRSAGSQVTGVLIPQPQNIVATYPIAIVKSTHNRPAALAFIEQEVSGVGQQELQAHGFQAR